MIANKYQDHMFGLLQKVIDEIGPRAACSEAEKKLGRLLVEEWKPICDRIDVEPFTCSPTATYGSFYIMVLFYFATVILYWFLPPLALALAIVNCSIVFSLLRELESVHFLFPRRQGENIAGTIQPMGKPVQRVIVEAHIDSAYENTLVSYYLKSAGGLLVSVAMLALVIAVGGTLAKTIAYYDVFSNQAVLTGVGIALITLVPLMGLFIFHTNWKPVPGARDNMSGVSVVAGLGKYLGEAKSSGAWFPERTAVVLLGTSSHESGALGAKRYVRRHLEELKATPTYVVSLDTICDEKFLSVLTLELFIGARHDPRLVKMAQEVAADHNWPLATTWIPGLGGWDASHFTVNGIPAMQVFSCNLSDDPYSHTRYDTYEHVRPESLSVALQLIIDMIQRIDKT